MSENRYPIILPSIAQIPTKMRHNEPERVIVTKAGRWILMSTGEWESEDSTKNYLTLIQAKPEQGIIDGCEHYIKLSEHNRILAERESFYIRQVLATIAREITPALGEIVTNVVAKYELYRDIQRIQVRQDALERRANYVETREKQLQERQAGVKIGRQPSGIDGFVYLVKSKYSKHWKIGRTKNIKDRMRMFEVKLPFEVTLVHTIKCKDMYTAEKSLHRRYAEKRVNGEWFALTEQDIEDLKQIDEL